MTDSPDRPIRVLYVDDDPDLLEVSATFLARASPRLAVATAESAEAGSAYLDEESVDCVVSDYQMPGTDGLAFLATVREADPDLPFILVTGEGSEEVASAAISAGVTDYFTKGAGTEQYVVLGNRIEHAVEKRRVADEGQRHRQAIETAREGIALLDPAGRFTAVNAAYADVFGYAPDDVVGEDWSVVYGDDAVGGALATVRAELERTGHWQGELTGTRRDGSTFVGDHSVALADDGTTVSIVRDVTDRHERERELEMYEAAVEAARDGITVLDAAGNFRMVNGVFAEVVGIPKEELIGRDPTFLVERGVIDRSAVEAAIGKVLECLQTGAEQITFETPVHSPTFGEEIVEHNLALLTGDVDVGADPGEGSLGREVAPPVPIPVDLDAVRGAVITHRKISERKRREQALKDRERELERQNDRLEKFTAVVSHDLRNPLNVAMGGASLLREYCDTEDVDRIEVAHRRMEQIIEDLLALARHGAAVEAVEVVAGERVVADAWASVDTAGATLSADLDLHLRADPGRLQQLFENLFRNAIEHAGPDVRIRVGALADGDGFFVEDDGPGIPEADRPRVFDPGYSTIEGNTGLGLNIVTEIADAHGWAVRVAEGERGGARIEVTGIDVADQADTGVAK